MNEQPKTLRDILTDALYEARAYGNGRLAADVAGVCEGAIKRAGLVVVSERGLVALVEGVAEQQAMPDDSYKARLRALLAGQA